MSKNKEVAEFFVYVDESSSSSFSLYRFKANHYKIKKIGQLDLVNFFKYHQQTNLLKPLHSGNISDCNSELIAALGIEINGLETFLETFNTEVNRNRLIQVLDERQICIYSAIVEAYSPQEISKLFGTMRVKNTAEEQVKIMTWDEFSKQGYDDFFKKIKKLLPKGKHSEFYNKRVQIKLAREKKEKDSKNKLLNDAKELSEQKKAVVSENLGKGKVGKTVDNSANEGMETSAVPTQDNEPKPELKITNTPKAAKSKPKQNSGESNWSAKPSPAPTPRPKVKSNRPEVKKTEPSISVPAYDPNDPSNRELPLPEEKRTEMPSISYGEVPEIEPKPVQTKPESFKPKPDPPKPLPEPPKPKKNLLEQMKDLASTKQEKATPKSKQISYPPIFTEKNWKKYWSNSNATKGSIWKQFFWNCNSIGKSYLMKSKGRDKLQREFDVNQDFAIVNPGRGSLRAILFDGVSQSRAPRQWAECLAETFIENKLNIRKLKSHSTEVEDWHNSSIEKWDKWIENHYLPQRQHLPDWRLKNEKNQSFTTFLVIEIDSKMIKLANIGDSAVFCKFKSGEIRHLPTTYNHLLRPKNISTTNMYKPDEMEFYEFKVDALESLIACTDSIADYIFDEDKKRMNDKYDECLYKLSTKGDKFDFMSKMIAKGPSNEGWLEDDVTFFSLVRSGGTRVIRDTSVPENNQEGCEEE